MTTDNCPHCGAEVVEPTCTNFRHWACGTQTWTDGTSYRDLRCYKAELTRLRAENAGLRERLAVEESGHLNAMAVCYAVGEHLAGRITKDELESTVGAALEPTEESEGE